MDLGVARHTELSTALTKEGQFAGSLLYAAPEQFRDREVGPSADLYALGVMLYELASGVNPFRHDEPAAVVNAHLEESPERLDRRTEDTSPFLSDVVATLLAKDPDARLESAGALARILDEGEGASWWHARERALLEAHERRVQVPVRRETRVYGREDDLALLAHAWTKAQAGDGNTVRLEGEAGIGKSRLVDQLLSDLDGLDAHVLYGSYPPSGGVDGIFAGILAKFGAASLESALGPRLALTPSLVPAFAAVVRRGAPPTASTFSAEALHAATCQLLTALSDERPLVWVIEEIEVPSAVRDLIELRLGSLTKEDRAILDVASVGGFEFDADLIARVQSRPRMAVLQDVAHIERRSGVVRALGHRTLFDHHQIQEVLYEDLVPALREEYHTLLARAYAERLEGAPSGVDAAFLAFHHLRGRLPTEGVPHLTPALDHLSAALQHEAALDLATRALDRPKVLEGPERVEVLLCKALRHDYRGEHDLQRRALDEAVALADAGLDPVPRTKALTALGAHLQQGSCWEDAQARYTEVEALAQEAGEPGLALSAIHGLSFVFWRQGFYEEARTHMERHLMLARETGDRVAEATALGNLALICLRRCRFEEARRGLEENYAIALEAGDLEGAGVAAGNLGHVFLRQGDFDAARGHYERQLAIARETGDRANESLALGNPGNVLASLGRDDLAHDHLAGQLALARAIGARSEEALGGVKLARVLLRRGLTDAARECSDRSLAIARDLGLRRLQGVALFALSDVASAAGDMDDALRRASAAADLLRKLDEKAILAKVLTTLGVLETQRGEHQTAAAHLDEALALARDVGARAAILLACVHRAQLRGGDTHAALSALDEHQDHVPQDVRMKARFLLWKATRDPTHLLEAKRLLDHLVEHAPEEYRESILTNVKLHREIMEAWAEQA